MAIPVEDKGLQVKSIGKDDEGNPLEPEQRPAQHSFGFQPAIRMTTGEVVSGGFNHQPEIQHLNTAGHFATEYRHKCYLCKFFDARAFYTLWSRVQHDPLDPIHARLHKLFGSIYQEHGWQPSDFGICHALAEVFKGIDTPFVHFDGGCPTYPGPNGEDLSNLFRAKDLEAARYGAQAYDTILKTAEGVNTSWRRLKRKVIMRLPGLES